MLVESGKLPRSSPLETEWKSNATSLTCLHMVAGKTEEKEIKVSRVWRNAYSFPFSLVFALADAENDNRYYTPFLFTDVYRCCLEERYIFLLIPPMKLSRHEQEGKE